MLKVMHHLIAVPISLTIWKRRHAHDITNVTIVRPTLTEPELLEDPDRLAIDLSTWERKSPGIFSFRITGAPAMVYTTDHRHTDYNLTIYYCIHGSNRKGTALEI